MTQDNSDSETGASSLPAWHEEVNSAMELLEQGNVVNCLTALHALLQDHGEDAFCRAIVFDGMGRALFMDNKPELGLEAFNESLSILRKLYSEQKISASILLGSNRNLAHALMVTGNLEESLKSAKASLAMAEKAGPPDNPEIAHSLFTLAATLYAMKEDAAAETHLLQAKKILENSPDAPDELIGTILNNLGKIYEDRGEIENAITYFRRAVEFCRKVSNKENLAMSLGNLGVALGASGKLQKACEALGESVVIYSALNLGGTPEAQAFAANLETFQKVLIKKNEASNEK